MTSRPLLLVMLHALFSVLDQCAACIFSKLIIALQTPQTASQICEKRVILLVRWMHAPGDSACCLATFKIYDIVVYSDC